MSGWNVAGWVGDVLVVVAYISVTRRPSSRWFHVANLLGGSALVVNGVGYRDDPFIALNVVWAGIAMVGIWKWRSHTSPQAEA
jgi:hypothetical protein